MPRLIASFLIITIILIAGSSTVAVRAQQGSVDDEDFIVAQSPQEVTSATRQIQIIVHSKKGSFVPTADYAYKAWNITDGKGESDCPLSNYHKAFNNVPTKPSSPNLYVAYLYPDDCSSKKLGTWKFQLWAGKDETTRGDINNMIIKDYRFNLDQVGGQRPSINAQSKEVKLGESPVIILNNARTENTYTFWWEGARTEIAGKISQKSGTIPLVLNATSGIDFNQPGDKKICMNLGDFSWPVWTSCLYSEVFTFKANVSPPGPAVPGGGAGKFTCGISPPNPQITDDVGIIITKATAGSEFSSMLDGKKIDTQKVDANGIVSLALGSKLPAGNYTGSAVDTSGQSCEIKFSVGLQPQIAAPSCTNCSSAAGSLCDPGTGAAGLGGILTAVGCVPYEPYVFVNSMLVFLFRMAGGIALLIMAFGSFEMLTSAGNPESIKKGQDRFTNAVIGLLFLIFSSLLLQLIGIDILQIPGLRP